jgi:hypothetical protein
MARLAPEVVVPGHNEISGLQLLVYLTQYLTELRGETRKRQDSAMSREAIHPVGGLRSGRARGLRFGQQT